MPQEPRIADLIGGSIADTARIVREGGEPAALARVEAEAVLVVRTRRAVMDAVRTYAATVGTLKAAHLLVECAVAVGAKERVGGERA